jgi:hypothetical protein
MKVLMKYHTGYIPSAHKQFPYRFPYALKGSMDPRPLVNYGDV